MKSTDTTISQRTNVYAEGKMLEHTQPVVVLDKFGATKPMPKNKSTTITFRRAKSLTPVTTPLLEGVTPASRGIEFEDVSGSLAQYGDVLELTDVIEDTHEDPILNEMVQLCGENIGATIEKLTWGVLSGGTSVFRAGGVASRALVATAISKNLQRKVTRYLDAQKAKKFTKILSSSTNYGTEAVEAAYIAVAHTDLDSDIRNISGFIPVADYGTRKTVCMQEVGSVENVRYVLSPDLDPFLAAGPVVGATGMVAADDTNLDIYPVIYLGMNAYGTVPLRGQGAVEPSIIPVNQKTKDDPLGQRGYVGFKTWFLAMILNQAWMARAEVAVTDL